MTGRRWWIGAALVGFVVGIVRASLGYGALFNFYLYAGYVIPAAGAGAWFFYFMGRRFGRALGREEMRAEVIARFDQIERTQR